MKRYFFYFVIFIIIGILTSCQSTNLNKIDTTTSNIVEEEVDYDAEIRRKMEQEPLLIVSYDNYFDTTTIIHRLFKYYGVVKKEGYKYSASVNMSIVNDKPELVVRYDGDDWKFMNSVTFYVPEPRQKLTLRVEDWDVYRDVGYAGHCYESFYVTIPEEDIATIKNMLNYELQIVIDNSIFCNVNDETKQAMLELFNYRDYELSLQK